MYAPPGHRGSFCLLFSLFSVGKPWLTKWRPCVSKQQNICWLAISLGLAFVITSTVVNEGSHMVPSGTLGTQGGKAQRAQAGLNPRLAGWRACVATVWPKGFSPWQRGHGASSMGNYGRRVPARRLAINNKRPPKAFRGHEKLFFLFFFWHATTKKPIQTPLSRLGAWCDSCPRRAEEIEPERSTVFVAKGVNFRTDADAFRENTCVGQPGNSSFIHQRQCIIRECHGAAQSVLACSLPHCGTCSASGQHNPVLISSSVKMPRSGPCWCTFLLFCWKPPRWACGGRTLQRPYFPDYKARLIISRIYHCVKNTHTSHTGVQAAAPSGDPMNLLDVMAERSLPLVLWSEVCKGFKIASRTLSPIQTHPRFQPNRNCCPESLAAQGGSNTVLSSDSGLSRAKAPPCERRKKAAAYSLENTIIEHYWFLHCWWRKERRRCDFHPLFGEGCSSPLP